ncbi:HAD-IB family hydrolase [Paractinoplanes globisporus]|uniref:HAD-IB family hydrolase n=1 Tax=Paractinoplanes globisporus TaxID=113565 RepID=A0ABW6WCM8_9ACTN|nr:HAD-IB family hydrolase [Actinoplanes globisporus]
MNSNVPPLTVVEPPQVMPATGSGTGEPRRGRPAAVWDLDGTLTRTDTLLPFLRRVAGTAAVVRALAVAATRELPRHGRRDAAKALVLQQLLGGRELGPVDQVARDYALRVRDSLRADSMRLWSWHGDNGHRLVIASASPGLYVHHLGRLLGADEVICTEMAVVNGRLTGALRGGNCRGHEKARRVLEHLREQPASQVWAYANGAGDRPLLEIADVAVRVTTYRHLTLRDDR